jgi:hypothetical protein
VISIEGRVHRDSFEGFTLVILTIDVTPSEFIAERNLNCSSIFGDLQFFLPQFTFLPKKSIFKIMEKVDGMSEYKMEHCSLSSVKLSGCC